MDSLGITLCLCTLVAILLLAGVASTVLGLLQQSERLKQSLQRLQQASSKQANLKPAPHLSAIPEAQALAVNAAVQQLNLPWRDVLNAIEAATPKSIALISLEPDAKAATLRGHAEAKTPDDMIAYIEQLKKEEFFIQVQLLKHEIVEQDPNRPYRFQFEVLWEKDKP
ncbi:PilN domain-containing protein [Undibacterium sp.]|uniref:PilN domain-containing protein n=1 Tax=Undibacterium sp. TaxID=1914977 RepID=UPI002BEE5D91|nr:PilN domain-containing protein [Undibacterium sp.]HTD05059.1 PilN domain-containing protein [Undibacterium sp.]